MSARPKKERVRLEREKLRSTSHWDLDYLPWQDVEDYFSEHAHQANNTISPDRKPKGMISHNLGLVCLIAGLVLLVLAVLAGQIFL